VEISRLMVDYPKYDKLCYSDYQFFFQELSLSIHLLSNQTRLRHQFH
jgi:hypothetical protein